MTPAIAPRPSRDEVLLDFATREGNLSPQVLAEFISRFPEHAPALAQFAREMDRLGTAPCSELSAEDLAEEDAAIAAALAECEAHDAAAEVADPFTGKTPQTFQEAARALEVPLSFISRFKDRRIIASTVPESLLGRLAQLFQTTREALKAALEQEPRLAAAAQFRANQKPSQLGKMTFEEAMEEAELPEDVRERLRAA